MNDTRLEQGAVIRKPYPAGRLIKHSVQKALADTTGP